MLRISGAWTHATVGPVYMARATLDGRTAVVRTGLGLLGFHLDRYCPAGERQVRLDIEHATRAAAEIRVRHWPPAPQPFRG